MHHWCKCSIDLYGNIFTLEANRVTDFVPINMDTNKCRVNKFYFDIFVSSLKGDLLLCFYLSTLLNFLDNKFHLGHIKWTIWLRTTVADCVSYTLNKLAGNTDNHALRL
ncbi:hypothetical protein D3C73_1170500 [compost metagenome]